MVVGCSLCHVIECALPTPLVKAGFRPKFEKNDCDGTRIPSLTLAVKNRWYSGTPMSNAPVSLPPHISVLLDEHFDLANPISVRKKLRGMAGDLRDQAELTSPSLPSESGPSDQFKVILSGGLDLFGGEGACQALRCRIKYVDEVARSIALLADQVTLRDHLMAQLMRLPRRPKNSQIEAFLPDLYVLKRLSPLLKSGVVRFIAPVAPCSSCLPRFDAEVDATTDELMTQIGEQISVKRSEGEVSINTGAIYDPPLACILNPDLWHEGDYELKRMIVRDSVKDALLHARDAGNIGGVVFSNSRLGMNGLLHQDGQRLDQRSLDKLVMTRTAQLPWVDGLSVTQTIQLREQASAALPSLRAFMAKRLANGDVEANDPDALELMSELREQALDVRAELELASSKSRSIARNATGVLGLGIAALSVGIDGGSFGTVGSLIATLSLIHQMPAPDDQHQERLKRRPGYVLVAAQNILSHAS